MLKTFFLQNRSYRRFIEDVDIPISDLKDMIEFVRLSPATANLQPLRYIISNDPETNEKIFPALNWAGYLRDWDGPVIGERPSAYIIIVSENLNPSMCDHGIALLAILLAATEKRYGGCAIASIKRDILRKNLQIDEKYEIPLVIALGKPAEEITIENIKSGEDVKYWRDANNKHHVPKIIVDELIIETHQKKQKAD